MSIEKRQILDMNAFDRHLQGGSVAEQVKRRLSNLGSTSVLFYQEPIEMVSASGAWMTAQDGSRFLDFYNNVLSVGHCHPTVVEAISRQTARLTINTRYLNRVVDDYLEALKARLPNDLSNLALTCSGSEANDLAMRIACKVTGKRGFIVTENAYHGNTQAVTEISPSALKTQALPEHVVTVPAPGRSNYPDGNLAEGFAQAIEQAACLLEKRGYGLAAFICDSVFSSDGVFAHPTGLLTQAVECVHRHGGLYIADEVQPGFARTGTGFWGFEHHQAAPDLITMGKPMGNGYPIAGLAARPDYFDRFSEDVGYFNTFGGNPVAAAAGHAVLDVIEHEGLQQNARDSGRYLAQKLEALSESCNCISEVRSLGLFIGVEVSKNRSIEEPDPQRASAIIAGLRYQKVLIGAAGKFGNVLKIRPPLCTSQAEADFFINALSTVLSES
ncbi:aspartate aminotransferase family protein [Granulosicoccus sp. 3-233]|uniref:aspartate aminotransferase family protein n=1 Tax=Granulosicoccus sp. 3-233 TaxID=3417969 RepID=UPI003D32D3CB